MRINKFISICGISSRRGAERLILDGKVSVNGETISHPGTIIDEEKDTVKVNGVTASPVSKKIYILLNKPNNVLTALSDPFQRKTVAHLTSKLGNRVYPVGRLDYDTKGVLIMTNDGELAYRLSHPKYEIKRVYQAQVEGAFTQSDAEKIHKGIKLIDGHIGHGTVRILATGLKTSKVELTLQEGHKREVKQLLKAVGHAVRTLQRVEFAGLRTGEIKPGRWRYINKSELANLKKLVGME